MIKIACDLTTVKCTKVREDDCRNLLYLQQNFAKMLKPRVQAVVITSCFQLTSCAFTRCLPDMSFVFMPRKFFLVCYFLKIWIFLAQLMSPCQAVLNLTLFASIGN